MCLVFHGFSVSMLGARLGLHRGLVQGFANGGLFCEASLWLRFVDGSFAGCCPGSLVLPHPLVARIVAVLDFGYPGSVSCVGRRLGCARVASFA